MRGSREISLVPSLHRASTDALILAEGLHFSALVIDSKNTALQAQQVNL